MTKLLGANISDHVLNGIIDLIVSRGLKSGDRPPSERELAQMFNSGRPAVREAVRALHMLNIVEIRSYDGLYVATANPRILNIPFQALMDMGKFNLEQLFEIRLFMEPEVVAIASQKITDEQIVEIEEIVNAADVSNANQFAESDTRFHQAIYSASDNYLLQVIMHMINDLSTVSREVTGGFGEVRQIVHADHLAIVDALKKRDAAMCREKMGQHIQNLKKIVEINNKLYKVEFLKLLKHEIDFSDEKQESLIQ